MKPIGLHNATAIKVLQLPPMPSPDFSRQSGPALVKEPAEVRGSDGHRHPPSVALTIGCAFSKHP
ncbi:MAG: hypothetical protein V4689_20920 [Verrucomicrobiota bacterium]